MEDVTNPAYWSKRLERVIIQYKGDLSLAEKQGNLHHIVYLDDRDKWLAIEKQHRNILQQYIKPGQWILDGGCGWGRLYNLLPEEWRMNKYSGYIGVDICPSLIQVARNWNYVDPKISSMTPQAVRGFAVMDLRNLSYSSNCFDWAVLISIKPMIERNLGIEFWQGIEKELKRVSSNILLLEYDPLDQGQVI